MMSPNKHVNVSDSIPTLHGRQNYAEWIKSFRVWCMAEDVDYWDIYTGIMQSEIKQTIRMTEDAMRIRCALHHEIKLEDVTESQLETWARVNITEPNQRFAIWITKNYRMLRMISNIVSENILDLIGNEEYVCRINIKLAEAFGPAICELWLSKFDALLDVTYKPGMSPEQFVRNFNRARLEKSNYEGFGNVSTNWDTYGLFVRAVRANREMSYWVQDQHTDMNSPTLVEDAISSFLSAEAYRKNDLLACRIQEEIDKSSSNGSMSFSPSDRQWD